MAEKVRGPVKFVLFVGIALALLFGGKFVMGHTTVGKQLASKAMGSAATSSQIVDELDGKPAVNVCVVTWGGYAGGQYFNKGFKASKDSRYWTEYQLPVNFVLIDDYNPSREAWKADRCHLLWNTADAFPVEAASLAAFQPQIIFQSDWSRGGDVFIGKATVKSVKDLKGKRVAFLEGSPSHTFLLKSLEAAGMSQSDIIPVTTPSAPDAAKVFKNGEADAAVVWSPDDQDLLTSVPGARVLASTKQAANIIADVFYAKKAYVDSHQAELKSLVEGWLKGAAEINASADAKAEAVKILAAGLNQPDDFILNAINNVRLTTYGDNVAFFAIKSGGGVTGQFLYEDMGRKYKAVKLVEGSLPNWRDVATTAILRQINLTGPENAPEGTIKFAKADKAAEEAEAFASKSVTIEFPSGRSELTEDAKFALDAEVANIVKGFTGARIRVEGNTDNVGSDEVNERLSLARAQSVISHLVGKYGYDRNRFVAVGHGARNPVADNGTPQGRQKNRRTDVQIIAR
jgi:NitT/TauT family transport system substrate-binding protein